MKNEILDEELIDNGSKKPMGTRRTLIWAGLVVVAIITKILHLKGCDACVLISTGGLLASSCEDVLNSQRKTRTSPLFMVASILWLLILICGIIFNRGIPFNMGGFSIYITIVFFFFCYYLIRSQRGKKRPSL